MATENVGLLRRLASLFAFAVPWIAVGNVQGSDYLGISLPACIVVAMAPLVAIAGWSERSWLFRQPLVLAALTVAAAGVLSSFLGLHAGGLRQAAKELELAVAVLAVAMVARREQGRASLVGAALRGAGFALVVAFAGYLAAACLSLPENVFAFASPHPLFSGVPRLTGTYGFSPQRMGGYLVVVIALSQMRDTPKLRASALLALVLTFSWAWIGGLTLLVRRCRWWLVGTAAVAGTFLINIGLPSHLGKAGERTHVAPCESLDTDHYVTRRFDDGSCEQYFIDSPYRARESLYLAAKRFAIEAILQEPLWGVGAGGFRHFSLAREMAEYGWVGYFYWDPQCLYLELPASRGVAGWLALLVLVLAMWRSRAASPAFIGLIAFAVIGLNSDVLTQRHLWLLWGLAAAQARS